MNESRAAMASEQHSRAAQGARVAAVPYLKPAAGDLLHGGRCRAARVTLRTTTTTLARENNEKSELQAPWSSRSMIQAHVFWSSIWWPVCVRRSAAPAMELELYILQRLTWEQLPVNVQKVGAAARSAIRTRNRPSFAALGGRDKREREQTRRPQTNGNGT